MPSRQSTPGPSFQQVLDAQNTRKTATPTPAGIADPVAHARRIRSLEMSLGNTPEVSGFLRGGQSFTLHKDDSGCIIERADGATLRLPADSPATQMAQQLDALKTQQKAASGVYTQAAEASGWLVTLSVPIQRSSRV